MATSAPRTPSKKRNDEPARLVQQINNKYNLGIPATDQPITPQAQRTLGRQNDTYKTHSGIAQLARYLFYSDRAALSQAIDGFDAEARKECRQWVKKPHAVNDLFPKSPDPPRASGDGQQIALQKILLARLEEAKSRVEETRPKPPSRITRSTAAASATGPSLQATTPSISPEKPPTPDVRARLTRNAKRRSEDGTQDASTKRAKGPEMVVPFAPLTNVKTTRDRSARRSTGNGPDSILPFASRPLARSLRSNLESSDTSRSTSTSRASLHSNVFSFTGDDDAALPDSQTTVAASTQEQKRGLELRGVQGPPTVDKSFYVGHESQSSYAASPGIIEAFHESFRTPASNRGFVDHQPSSGLRSEYSNFPDLADFPEPLQEPGGLDTLMLDADADTGRLEEAAARLAPRLTDIWPRCPAWLLPAPFPVIWEVTRVALHCGVVLGDSDDPKISRDDWKNWKSQSELRKVLWKIPSLCGKVFPESSNTNAWELAVKTSKSDPDRRTESDNDKEPQLIHETVVYIASMDFSSSKDGPLYKLKLKSIKLDQPCRLSRRFGPHNFLEILIPSYNSSSSPSALKEDDARKALVRWFTRSRHPLVGRMWRAFYVKDGGYRKAAVDFRLGPEPKTILMDRMYFYAESDSPSRTVPSMLNWLLQLEHRETNRHPYLKVFSRIALGLSRTTPTVVFERHQIQLRDNDLRSPSNQVMNDGVARMSLTVARKIRDILGLKDIPSAVQGRLGSAKGMWILDIEDRGLEDWIETYPSQRKWCCDFVDVHHRTLEIRSHATELRPARLNLQLLPVLEERAKDKSQMRTVISELLTTNLTKELDGQRDAMSSPLRFRQWLQENSSSRQNRVLHNCVPFTGGLPARDEDIMAYLLDAGFEPTKQKYIQDIAWKLQSQRCETLKEKLNIHIGQSAYMYMVVDFWGVLEEDEVHVSFTSRFRDEESQFSDICLDGIDVLVARSPAHFPSDIQRVKAVFKRELRALGDVIVFPRKGNVPLADKLSGGDYDGDQSWVCWDPNIVENFQNADVPTKPDLTSYFHKVSGTMRELQSRHGQDVAVEVMIEKSFEFNLRENLLGRCTNYKERMTYKRRTTSDRAAIMVSELLSNLVDQAKQGIEFTVADWNRLLKDIGEQPLLPEPAYKSKGWDSRKKIRHIIDHLKFEVAQPAIAAELARFHHAMNPAVERSPTKGLMHDEQQANYFDDVLAHPAKHFDLVAKDSKTTTALVRALRKDIEGAKSLWDKLMTSDRQRDEMTYPQRVQQVYEAWCGIVPQTRGSSSLMNSKTVAVLRPSEVPNAPKLFSIDPEHSEWSMYRGSMTFQMYYKLAPKFAWVIAGRQLARIKLMSIPGPIGAATPQMYAALKLDTTTAKQVIARIEGEGSQYHGHDDEDEMNLDDDA